MNRQPKDGSPPPEKHRRRVLVADDHEPGRMLAEAVLTLFNCEVVCVVDGEQACNAVATSTFDLVFLDVHMPVTNGLAVVTRIRSGEAGSDRHLPVIAMTASAQASEQAAALAAGMDAVLLKPFRLGEMTALLQKWCPPPQWLVANATHKPRRPNTYREPAAALVVLPPTPREARDQ